MKQLYCAVFFLMFLHSSIVMLGQPAKKIIEKHKLKGANDTVKVNSLNNLCETLIAGADYEKATLYAMAAQKLADSLNYDEGLARSYYNIGSIYFYQNDSEKSSEFLFNALKIFRQIKNQKGIADTYNFLGRNYINEPGNSKPLEYFLLAFDMYQQLNDKKGMAKIYGNIGVIYINKRDYPKANEYLLKALEEFKEIGDKRLICMPLVNLSYVNRQQKHFPKAIMFLKEALKNATESDSKEILKTVYASFSDFYESQRDFENAIKYYKLFEEINRKLLNENASRSLYELQAKHEEEKDEKEIQILKQQNLVKSTDLKNERIIIFFIIAAFIFTVVLSLTLYNRFKIKRSANELLAIQKNIVESKNKDIMDSILYAKRIQDALLASSTLLSEHLNDYFILFKPKDVVSGDFYWATHANDRFYIATADSTGHGVPGAFMSLLNISFLNEAINEKRFQNTDEILNHARTRLISSLKSDGSAEGGKDGMDVILTAFDFKQSTLEYSAANNSFYIIRNNELIHFPADKMPVGKSPKDHVSFTLQKVQLEKNDIVYTLTDGFPDQFGGPKGKKYKYKQLEELLLANCLLPMEEQKLALNANFENWIGDMEQVDDVCIIGIRI